MLYDNDKDFVRKSIEIHVYSSNFRILLLYYINSVHQTQRVLLKRWRGSALSFKHVWFPIHFSGYL